MTPAIPGPDPRFEEDYFRTNYADYGRQNPPRKLRFYRALAERACEGREHPRVLEIGCAFGMFLQTLGPRWDRYGTDVSTFAIDRARKAVPEARFAVCGAETLAFEGRFDLIAAFDVLEHVERLDAAGSAITSQLSPGGRLLFVVPVYDGPAGLVSRALDADATHVHKRSRRFWMSWTAQQHLVGEDRWGIVRYLLPGGYYLHVASRKLRSVAPALAVLARAGT